MEKQDTLKHLQCRLRHVIHGYKLRNNATAKDLSLLTGMSPKMLSLINNCKYDMTTLRMHDLIKLSKVFSGTLGSFISYILEENPERADVREHFPWLADVHDTFMELNPKTRLTLVAAVTAASEEKLQLITRLLLLDKQKLKLVCKLLIDDEENTYSSH